MKSLQSRIGLAVVLSCLTAGSSFATQTGTTWSEDGDAGQTTATGQQIAGIGSLTSISGAAPSYAGADLFKINISGAFTAATSAAFDPMLFLFDSAGNTLLFNDDYSGLQSHISGNSFSGDYWLGISHFYNGTVGGIPNPNVNATGFWNLGLNDSLGGSAYTIHLTGASFSETRASASPSASVPDAGTTASLLGLAILGLATVRRKLGC